MKKLILMASLLSLSITTITHAGAEPKKEVDKIVPDENSTNTDPGKCWFWQYECKITAVLNRIAKGEEPGPSATMFCRKGVASELTFSVRSFNGIACNYKIWAAAAVALCPKVAPDFDQSQCNQKAKETLGNDYNNPIKVLDEALSMVPGALKNAVCGLVGDKIPMGSTICPKTEDDKPKEEQK